MFFEVVKGEHYFVLLTGLYFFLVSINETEAPHGKQVSMPEGPFLPIWKVWKFYKVMSRLCNI